MHNEGCWHQYTPLSVAVQFSHHLQSPAEWSVLCVPVFWTAVNPANVADTATPWKARVRMNVSHTSTSFTSNWEDIRFTTTNTTFPHGFWDYTLVCIPHHSSSTTRPQLMTYINLPFQKEQLKTFMCVVYGQSYRVHVWASDGREWLWLKREPFLSFRFHFRVLSGLKNLKSTVTFYHGHKFVKSMYYIMHIYVKIPCNLNSTGTQLF